MLGRLSRVAVFVAAVGLVGTADPARAEIGFRVPEGTPSAAYNLVTPGEVMDLTAHPFVLQGDAFNDAFSRRYGHAIQHAGEVFQLPDAHGHGHTSDNYAYLATICTLNPAWFAQRGYGAIAPGTDCNDISEEEATDVQYAMGVGDDIYNESRRLLGVGSAISLSGPASVKAGQSATFTATATNCTPNATGWSWTTSGASGASSSATIDLTWSTTGSKTISVVNPGCPGAGDTKIVAVQPASGGGGGGGGGTLAAVFTFAPAAPARGASVAFDGSTSTGNIDSYLWNFGDGSPPAVGASASHAFANDGVYQVTLIVTGPGNCAPAPFCEAQKTVSLAVGTVGPVSASFTTNATCDPLPGPCVARVGTPVGFTSTSTGASSLSWSFGDGGGADTVQTAHTWAQPGTYTVRLSAANVSGSSVAERTFQVSAPPTATGAILLPGIAQATSGRVQTSDLYVHNPGTREIDVRLSFFKRGAPEPNPPRLTFTLAAGATLLLPDVLRQSFHRTNISGLMAIETTRGESRAVVTSFNTIGANLASQVGEAVSGTFREDTKSLRANGAGLLQDLVGLSDDASQAATLGVTNPTDAAASYRLTFFDTQGRALGRPSPNVQLAAFGSKQYLPGEIRKQFAVSATSDYRVVVEALGGGPLLPYAANVRTGSNDPGSIGVGDTGESSWYVLGARTGDGWRTDLLLSNLATATATATVRFTRVGVAAAPAAPFDVTLAPGETRRLQDVLKTFGVKAATGVLAVQSAGAGGLFPIVSSETFSTPGGAKRLGQVNVAQGDGEAAGAGQSQYLVGLRQDGHFKTTLWITNPGTTPGTYDVVYRDLGGHVLGRYADLHLLAGKTRAFAPAAHKLPATGIAGGFTVQVVAKAGKVLAAGQVVFPGGDPAYVRGVPR